MSCNENSSHKKYWPTTKKPEYEGLVVHENKSKMRNAFNVTLQDADFSRIIDIFKLNDEGRNEIYVK